MDIQNVGEKLFPDPTSKKSKLSISLDTTFYTICVIVWRVGDFRNILKPTCRPLTFTSYKSFLKNKKKSRTSVAALFSA